MTPAPREQWTLTRPGAVLQAYRYGSEALDAPTILLVHGYPDDHHVFDALVAELGDEARIISYDTRAAGRSRALDPGLDNFRLPRLAADLYAVVASIPGRSDTGASPVHVFGHDWGSIQAWEAMRDPRAVDTFASYISVSGPSVDHLRRWNRRHIGHPSQWPTIVGQLLRSWYVFGFAVPGLRRLVPRLFRAAGRRDFAGIDLDRNPERGGVLYRATVLPRMVRGPDPTCRVPTTLVVPTHDRFLSVRMAEDVSLWVPDLEVVRVDAGHWWPRTQPAAAAALVRHHLARPARRRSGMIHR
jgi:pimeloyl-ACP methyl ester carboxylesterase